MSNNVFSFWNVTYEEILSESNNLNPLKLTHWHDIPFTIIKDNADFFANFILQNFNQYFKDEKFPDDLKKADVSPVFKNGDHNDKTTYRSMSTLPWLSKIYYLLIYNQINQIVENSSSIL